MKIAIGSDHAGFSLKEDLKYKLDRDMNATVIDVGTTSEESVDYPIFAEKVVRLVQKKDVDFGILICGTGIGMSIAANKFEGIRAAKCNSAVEATLTRQHNDANILCLASRTVDEEIAMQIVKAFSMTDFSAEERHVRRLSMITGLECTNYDEMRKKRTTF
ncbi:MAG: ribose 5-phosphate isomerase B [Candidatus Micrarchaeia archaeon]|jgi:ribose 5-phosphate isomerase B